MARLSGLVKEFGRKRMVRGSSTIAILAVAATMCGTLSWGQAQEGGGGPRLNRPQSSANRRPRTS